MNKMKKPTTQCWQSLLPATLGVVLTFAAPGFAEQLRLSPGQIQPPRQSEEEN